MKKDVLFLTGAGQIGMAIARRMGNTLLTLTMLLAGVASTHAQGTNTKTTNMKNQKILVAFFSHTGENYNVGYITKGNTHIIAEMIARETGGTLFQIEPATPYPDNYNECIEVAKTEKNNRARPAIKADITAEDYDVIYLGYPNWWGEMPMAVYTFIEKHTWAGKTVIPFCTHEGSGLSGTEQKLRAACQGATIARGLAVQGKVAQQSQAQALKAVQAWLKK